MKLLFNFIKCKGNYIFFSILVFIHITMLPSCKKFVEVSPPSTNIVTASVFTSDATAIGAIQGIYSTMMANSGFNGNSSSIAFCTGLSSDELTNYSTQTLMLQFYKNGLNSNSVLGPLWDQPYQYIYAANAIIEGLNNPGGVSPSVKQQLIGEAKFIRAFCHFYLVNLFGDIPVITSTDYRVNTIALRTPKSKVYDQIILDLKEAQDLLSTSYIKSDGTEYPLNSAEKIRPNKWAATALLARVYLYIGDWANAEIQSSSIIDSKTYSLVSLSNVFQKNSNEAIWQLMPVINKYTNEGNTFILTAPPTVATLSPQLISAFETGDSRKSNWVGSYTQGSNTWYYCYKYKTRNGASSLTEYSMVLRLAEQYLIRAEAKAQQGKIIGATGALIDLDTVRRRAQLPDFTGSTDKTSVIAAIIHERQVELFAEWGHRWLDMKRTGIIDLVMATVCVQKGTSWNTNFQLYPIEQAQILNDPNMTQNPDY